MDKNLQSLAPTAADCGCYRVRVASRGAPELSVRGASEVDVHLDLLFHCAVGARHHHIETGQVILQMRLLVREVLHLREGCRRKLQLRGLAKETPWLRGRPERTITFLARLQMQTQLASRLRMQTLASGWGVPLPESLRNLTLRYQLNSQALSSEVYAQGVLPAMLRCRSPQRSMVPAQPSAGY